MCFCRKPTVNKAKSRYLTSFSAFYQFWRRYSSQFQNCAIKVRNYPNQYHTGIITFLESQLLEHILQRGTNVDTSLNGKFSRGEWNSLVLLTLTYFKADDAEKVMLDLSQEYIDSETVVYEDKHGFLASKWRKENHLVPQPFGHFREDWNAT